MNASLNIPATPAGITEGSFAIIRRELAELGYHLQPPQADIIERLIHTSADFDFAEITRFSPGAIEAGIDALRRGCAVVSDVNMVRVGVSAARLGQFGGAAHCFVGDAAARQRAEQEQSTRSALGIRLAAEQGLVAGGIVAVGNAPTALYETIRLIETGVKPALVIGVPVGFVEAAESKAALAQVDAVPWIVTEGRKGGSTIAVAIINALLRLAADAPPTAVD